MLSPKEAIGRCAGDRALLEQGLREKRIIKSSQSGMPMYYFPKFEHSRETLWKKGLQGECLKEGEDENGMDMIAGDMEWQPAAIVADGLELPSMLPSTSSASSLQPLPALTLPPTPQGPCNRVSAHRKRKQHIRKNWGGSIKGLLWLKNCFWTTQNNLRDPDPPGVSDEEKQKLASQLADLSKSAAVANKIIHAAENALTKDISQMEAELMTLNLEKLRIAALEAEEVWSYKAS